MERFKAFERKAGQLSALTVEKNTFLEIPLCPECIEERCAHSMPASPMLSSIDVPHTKAMTDNSFEESVKDLADLVQRKCGWLRIRYHTILRKSSNYAVLCFYICGLQTTKAEWKEPLLLAASAVLRSSGVTCTYKDGNLMIDVHMAAQVQVNFVATDEF